MPSWESGRFVYRVESDHSRAQMIEDLGILSEGNQWVPFRPQDWRQRSDLQVELWVHLNWGNRRPTAFISTSSDREWAFHEAKRRRRAGETNVRVHMIDASRLGAYRSREGHKVTVMKLDTWLNVAKTYLPEYADFPCSENEYLFLHCIPEDLIVKTWWW
ncbi:hypothetical protein BO82DRAFT_351980 [Aspergillus uvarum CBS 121591]|uniref:DUF7587 domain-containing protein n=1 Tax=Aspergillus uvarum CBS 121591 TaxID=1448315 RepID=A0A319CJA0_9EURO|nr:hypothetical protein BO82DRAFT_351980 [Aspergillus uvarum CBS 121591]PYH84429.1 hypothetical protein BO82DRAFT_351980 [Aspergillus uvarum CBS 121591]